jgi:hypothetical protein
LDTCVHVGFIVVTDRKDIIVSFRRAGKGQQADIKRLISLASTCGSIFSGEILASAPPA